MISAERTVKNDDRTHACRTVAKARCSCDLRCATYATCPTRRRRKITQWQHDSRSDPTPWHRRKILPSL
jgi:hypothetical protein